MKTTVFQKKIFQTSEVSALEPQLWATLPSQERVFACRQIIGVVTWGKTWSYGAPINGLINGQPGGYNAYKWSYSLQPYL